MKTLVCSKPGSFDYEERPMPLLEKGQALLRIRRIGICGTDLHAFEGTQPFFEYPRILGHELAAELADPGDAKGFEKGEIVSIIPYFHCGTCIACRSGLTNCCEKIRVCGVHINGGMAEYLAVPSYALLKSEGLGLDELSLVEPLAIGAHGVRRAGVRAGEFVLVVGAGPIGLGIAELARIAGGRVIISDVNDQRLQFCNERLGVTATIHPMKEDTGARLRELTGGDMPTVVIDATGNLKAIQQSFSFMAHGARYVLVGLQRGDISFSHPEFHKREATLMSSRNATREDFEHVIRAMKSKQVNPLNYITHRVQFDEVKDRFASWLDPKTGVIKATVELN